MRGVISRRHLIENLGDLIIEYLDMHLRDNMLSPGTSNVTPNPIK